jgi:pimeloyl-ACP methyl ester carboxylesterase
MDAAVWNVMLLPMSRVWPEGIVRNTRQTLEEQAEVYNQKPFFDDPRTFYPEPQAPSVEEWHVKLLPEGGAIVDLSFPAGYEPFYEKYRKEYAGYVENHTARARWFRSARPRPTLLCLHGMGTGPFGFETKMFSVDRWLAAGLDVVLYQLPFHGLRRPAEAPTSALLIPSPHLCRTNEGFRQAMWELEGLIAWLRAQGAPAIGVYGFSFGAYVASLLSTLVAPLDWLWLCCPPASISHVMWHGWGENAARQKAVQAGITEKLLDEVFAVHSPLLRTPLVPTERTFFIVGRGDRVTKADQVELLWEHYGRPRLSTFTGGHVAQLGRDRVHDELEEWLADLGITPRRRSFTQRVSELPRKILSWNP